MKKVVFTMPEAPNGRFIGEFLNPEGELVAKVSFDHHQQNHAGFFMKNWLEHNELPATLGTYAEELEFHPEHLGNAGHPSKRRQRLEDEDYD